MGFLSDIENLSIDEKFHKYLPNTLYLSHYDLAQSYGHTPEEWRKYLRDNHLFIESELAAITEAEARAALSRLGNAGGQEVTALKALLDKSKLINDAQRQNVKVVMTFIPSNEEELAPKKEEPKHVQYDNTNFVSSQHTATVTRSVPETKEVTPQKPQRVSKYR